MTKHKVVEKEKALKALAKEVGIPVFYSTHMYTPMDYKNWKSLNGIDKIMFDLPMFAQGTWGHEIHPELLTYDNRIVMNPHKGLSNFWSGDAAIQLRQYHVETIILYGMSANMCIESHARDAIENGLIDALLPPSSVPVPISVGEPVPAAESTSTSPSASRSVA